MRKMFFIAVLLMFMVSTASCASLSEGKKKNYGILESAAVFSAQKVIGIYGDNIPDDFNAEKFMVLMAGRIPDSYYDELKKYRLEIKPRKTYYLLLIYETKNGILILFDYSCTSKVDGPVMLEPEKYNEKTIEEFDRCRN